MNEINISKIIEDIRKDIAPINKTDFFATIIIDSLNINGDGEVEFVLSGELFNEEILKYDNMILTAEQVEPSNERLFFYGYSNLRILFSDFCKMAKKYELKICEFTDDNICQMSENDKCKLIWEIDDEREHIADLYRCFAETWNKRMANCLFKLKFCKYSKLKANVYFSASPFETKTSYLKFENITDEKLYSYITEERIFKKTSSLSGLNLNLDDPVRINTYNVGQGNFSVIECANGNNIAFDIGLTRNEKHHPKYNFAISKMGNLDVEYVFISHLDVDHILGIPNIPKKVFNKTWIVSLHGAGFSQSAKRLVAYLIHNNPSNTYFIDDCGNTKCLNNVYTLGQGSGKQIGHCTKINTGSLILSMDKNAKRALLPGDCIYTGIPDMMKGDCDFLLIPHHGCDLEGKIEIDEFSPITKHVSIAALSCGINTYGHPCHTHLCYLCKKGYKIEKTEMYDVVSYNF